MISLLGSDAWYEVSGSVSKSYTCNTGFNRKMLVAAGGEYAGTPAISSITYNSVSLTQIAQHYYKPSTSANLVGWYYLDHASYPTSVGSYTLTVNFSVTMAPGFLFVIELAGASQGSVSNEAYSYAASTTELETEVTCTKINSWIIGFENTGEVCTFTASTGQTLQEQLNESPHGSSAVMGYHIRKSTGAKQMKWTSSVSQNRLIQSLLALAPAIDNNPTMFGNNF